ncbi:MAG: D-alanyl-D-alanine carboxypeptidase [Candidatus Doudnabacteria bacterium]|nr:D-alanyl-D-alanine carboxypeptidase [Candidatus Doudnabacteria bacterium]
MVKKYLLITILCLSLSGPSVASALFMPANGSELADMSGVSAKAYVVINTETGEVLAAKNQAMPRVPASLTKLVTALVVLDTKPKLTKVVTMTAADQVAGSCGKGGACIKSKAGVKFTVDGLFHALLLPSANNAANALARSTGLSAEQFAQKMNAKAAELGATNSKFYEPTGLDPNNIITAEDYAKILTAAFKNSYLTKVAAQQKFTLRSSNNKAYTQTIKNTDKLLADEDIDILGSKTGYLNESQYNFAAMATYHNGPKLAIVVLGEDHLYSAFAETKILASLAEEAQMLAMLNGSGLVLGANTGNIK